MKWNKAEARRRVLQNAKTSDTLLGPLLLKIRVLYAVRKAIIASQILYFLTFAGFCAYMLYGGTLTGLLFLITLVINFTVQPFIAHKTEKKAIPIFSGIIWLILTIALANLMISGSSKPKAFRLGLMANDECGWAPIPNLRKEEEEIFHDELGYRNSLPYPKDRELAYIIQGDSNVYGFRLKQSETLSARLTHYLKTNVYNFGVHGYDPHQFYFLYRRETKRFKIDKRIIIFNLSNDFKTSIIESPNYFPRPYVDFYNSEKREVYPPAVIKQQFYGVRFIQKYKSYDRLLIQLPDSARRDFLRYIPPWLAKFPLASRLGHRLGDEVHALVGKADEIFGFWDFPAEPLDYFRPLWLFQPESQYPEPYKSYVKDLDLLMGEIKDQNPHVFVVCIPYRDLVVFGQEQLRKELAERKGASAEFDHKSLPSILQRICRRHKIGFFDPTDIFLSEANRKDLYQLDNNHISAKGSDFLARLVADRIRKSPAICFQD